MLVKFDKFAEKIERANFELLWLIYSFSGIWSTDINMDWNISFEMMLHASLIEFKFSYFSAVPIYFYYFSLFLSFSSVSKNFLLLNYWYFKLMDFWIINWPSWVPLSILLTGFLSKVYQQLWINDDMSKTLTHHFWNVEVSPSSSLCVL